MLDRDIESIVQANTDKSPIFYGTIKYSLKINRKFREFQTDKLVMKGTIKQISNNEAIKRKVVLSYYGNSKAGKKKAKDVDIDKIVITKVIVSKFLGYGIKLT